MTGQTFNGFITNSIKVYYKDKTTYNILKLK